MAIAACQFGQNVYVSLCDCEHAPMPSSAKSALRQACEIAAGTRKVEIELDLMAMLSLGHWVWTVKAALILIITIIIISGNHDAYNN